MSEEAEPTKKKGGKSKLILIIMIVLVMCGAGAAGGLYAAGAFTHEIKKIEEDPNKPRLVLKGEDPVAIAEEFTTKAGEGASAEKAVPAGHSFRLPAGGIDLPRPKRAEDYQATYFQLPNPFTSNLADTDAFVQVSIAVSTYYDGRVIDAVKAHDLPIRSEILMMLAQEQQLVLSTPEGKEALQKQLVKIINRVLREKTGYSGVDNVYFTNFVIQ
ncbi:flagellar basal body-associated FliL family protein [Sphingobium subterraneum]|uniref:Flagellar protein FliL n=1 Tax=Sphingobium subterraneum TaxID=627688 RepID=A0A841J2M3_9SPHN|nr:flagellar basal body-associated FliL family protein [Sphingobium subterraneum]MBB6123776.1 flagellar FliL protein [Sphingobium subterraneum]